MPIPIEALEQATRPLPEQIYAFLCENGGQAYELVEICAALEDTDEFAIRLMVTLDTGGFRTRFEPYVTAVERLVGEGKLISAERKGRTYYGAVR